MKIKLLLCCLVMLTVASFISAQEIKVRPGVGISFSTNDFSDLLLFGTPPSTRVFLRSPHIYVPVRIGENFRVEPEGSIFYVSEERTTERTGETSRSSGTTTIIRVGSGLFYVWSGDNSLDYYVGPRLGIFSTLFSSRSDNGEEMKSSTSQFDFFVGPSVGGEFFFTPQLSLGGEVQVNYISFGQPETERTPPDSSTSTTTTTKSVVISDALIFLRWYF